MCVSYLDTKQKFSPTSSYIAVYHPCGEACGLLQTRNCVVVKITFSSDVYCSFISTDRNFTSDFIS